MSKLNFLFEKLRSRSFFHDVSKLATGTVGGRLIYLLALPFLSRLYGPEDFKALGVYLAIVSTLAAIACFRFEIAIPIAENVEDAAVLFVLAMGSIFLVVGTASLAILILPDMIAGSILHQPDFAKYLWLVPFGVVFSASYNVTQYWATRHRRFGSIARTRISQSFAGALLALGLGWFAFHPLGLLLGNMISLGLGSGRFLADIWHKDKSAFVTLSFARVSRIAREYRRYPLFSMPESLINVAGLQIPIVLIAANAGDEAGYLFLAMQLMLLPMSLLGSSISQVFLSRAPDELRANRLGPFTLELMRRLVQIGSGPLIFAGVTAPVLFPLVLGGEWERSGEIAGILVPWLFLQFISSPVSMALHVTGNQTWMLVLTITGLLLRVGLVSAAIAIHQTELVVSTFAVASSLYYSTVLVFVTKAVGLPLSSLLGIGGRYLLWYLPSAFAAGLLVNAIMRYFLI